MIIYWALISFSKGEKNPSEVTFLGFSPQKAVDILLKKLEHLILKPQNLLHMYFSNDTLCGLFSFFKACQYHLVNILNIPH